ncbi:MAG: TIGR00282 family metallophosphoesterase [Armatimonadetes bacterium]|nr:TIGR00282 family metallophosphoesterase [Armatimonadota bacterium]
MRILFLGDIVGKVGRRAVQSCLPSLKETYEPDFVVVNAENSAAGFGVTPRIADELFECGVDGITLGNHAFHRDEIAAYLDERTKIVRPANFPEGTPGRGATVLEKGGLKLGLINLCGRVFMSEYDDPFRAADRLIEELRGRIGEPAGESSACILVDFHAEATSEKQAFASYLDGRVSAVIGTHTHVPTADERVLPGGTAYISDAGMCGPMDSIIGMDRQVVLRRFLTLRPARFEVGHGPGVICGVIVDVKEDTGCAQGIERIIWKDVS